MADPVGLSIDVRLMAVEIVLSEVLSLIHLSQRDPASSLQKQRDRFKSFFEGHNEELESINLYGAYPEEIQLAVGHLLDLAGLKVRRSPPDPS